MFALMKLRPGRPRSNCSICFWMAASFTGGHFWSFWEGEVPGWSFHLCQKVGKQGLVNVLIEHHPNLGDIISNRYVFKWCSNSPKWNIYIPNPGIKSQHFSPQNNYHPLPCRLRLAQLFVRLSQAPLKLRNGPHLGVHRHPRTWWPADDLLEITMFYRFL